MLFDSLISHPDVFQQKSPWKCIVKQQPSENQREPGTPPAQSLRTMLFSAGAPGCDSNMSQINQWLRPGHPHLRLVRKKRASKLSKCSHAKRSLLLRTTKTQVHIIAPQKTSFSVATNKVIKHDAWTCNSTPLKYLQIIYCPWSSSWFLL